MLRPAIFQAIGSCAQKAGRSTADLLQKASDDRGFVDGQSFGHLVATTCSFPIGAPQALAVLASCSSGNSEALQVSSDQLARDVQETVAKLACARAKAQQSVSEYVKGGPETLTQLLQASDGDRSGEITLSELMGLARKCRVNVGEVDMESLFVSCGGMVGQAIPLARVEEAFRSPPEANASTCAVVRRATSSATSTARLGAEASAAPETVLPMPAFPRLRPLPMLQPLRSTTSTATTDTTTKATTTLPAGNIFTSSMSPAPSSTNATLSPAAPAGAGCGTGTAPSRRPACLGEVAAAGAAAGAAEADANTGDGSGGDAAAGSGAGGSGGGPAVAAGSSGEDTKEAGLGCDTPCTFEGHEATCSFRIHWLAENSWHRNPCDWALGLVRQHCPVCEHCAVEASGCVRNQTSASAGGALAPLAAPLKTPSAPGATPPQAPGAIPAATPTAASTTPAPRKLPRKLPPLLPPGAAPALSIPTITTVSQPVSSPPARPPAAPPAPAPAPVPSPAPTSVDRDEPLPSPLGDGAASALAAARPATGGIAAPDAAPPGPASGGDASNATPYNCEAERAPSWDAQHRKWCCGNYGVGCERPTLFACGAGDLREASTLHRTWCCLHSSSLTAECPQSKAQAQQLANSVLRAVAGYAADIREPLVTVVAAADQNRDGMLSPDEFTSFITRCNVRLGEQAANITFAAFDPAGLGKVRCLDLSSRAYKAAALGLLGRKYDDQLRPWPRRVSAIAIGIASCAAAFIAFASCVRQCSRAGVERRSDCHEPMIAIAEYAPRDILPSRWRRCSWRRAARYEAVGVVLDDDPGLE